MDTKIEIKDHPLSDISSQNEKESLIMDVAMKTNSDAVLLDNDCDMAIKTEIKSETFFPDFCLQKERECLAKPPLKQINSEIIICSNNCEIDIKREIEQQTLVSDFGSQSERESLPEVPAMMVKKYSGDHEMDDKMEIKEERWWLEAETPSVCDDIKVGKCPPVKSPRLVNEIKNSTIRCSNSFEMDTKIEIKEEDSLSDVFSQNETEFFTRDVAMKTNSDAALLDTDCDIAIKEIKSRTPFPDVCLKSETECYTKCLVKNIKSEIITYSSDTEIDIKTEFEEQAMVSDFSFQNEREFLPEIPVIPIKECSSDHEMDSKIEIKEEPFWLETETSSVYDDIKVGECSSVKSPRLCSAAVSGECVTSPLPSAKDLEKNNSFYNGNGHPEYENQENIDKLPPEEKHVQTEQSNNYSDGKIYNGVLFLKENNLKHKGRWPCKCNICGKSFAQLSKLNVHECTKLHKGEVCKKRVASLSHLEEHSFIHEHKKPHKCEICEKRFTQLSALKHHNNVVHLGKRPHKCEICQKRFPSVSHLKDHMLIHEGKKSHKCEICKKRFTLLSHLQSHTLIHEGIKAHKCDICEKRFTQAAHLKVHSFTHGGIKVHKCEICEKRFNWLSQLKMHNLVHEGKKPHKCEICEKGFTRLSDLNRHNLIHEGKKPHRCEVCERRFTRLQHLQRHNLTHED